MLVNNQEVKPRIIELINQGKNYVVDKRYKLVVDIDPMKKNYVNCILTKEADDIKVFCESGQSLELISFYYYNEKLSIGTEGDIKGIKYNYLKNGIELIISEYTNINQIIFGVAWVNIKDSETEDIYTWFAADPTLYSKNEK